MLNDNELQLSKYGEYLLRRRLADERHAKFYVGWVRRFLQEVPDPKLSLYDRVLQFIENMQASGRFEVWQCDCRMWTWRLE